MALPATDSFKRSAATLGSSWTAISGAITDWILTVLTGASSSYAGAEFAYDYWNVDSFADDQYSQAVITKGSNGYQGVGVRLASGGNAYLAVLDSGTGGHVYKILSGTRSTVGTITLTWVDGDTLKIDAVGTTLTVYQNNVSRATFTSQTDLTSGAAGIVGYSDAPGTISDWQGGNVGGSTPYPSAIVNNPVRG